MKPITKAIIPVGGLGTRFLPATKAQPKEMLPLVDKPVIQYIVEEAIAAGIKDIIFVTSQAKRAIEDHFDKNIELEIKLQAQKKEKELEEIQRIYNLANFAYVRQKEPKGDGDALLHARHFIGNEPCAVLFGDDIVDHPIPCIKQLMAIYQKYEDPVIALATVSPQEVSKYGVIDGIEVGKRTHEIKDFVEKPDIDQAPSNLAVVGKYILTPKVFDYLEKAEQDKQDEIKLAGAFILMLRDDLPLYGYQFEGLRHDCGNKLEFLKATIYYALKREEFKTELREYLKSL